MAPRSGRVNPEVRQRGAARSFIESLDTYYRPARDARGEQALLGGIGALAGIAEQGAQDAQRERREEYFNQGTLDAAREAAGEEL